MTFLEIVQKADTLFGSQGTISSVATATGFQALIVEYVKNAWSNIQASRRHWSFYRSTATLTTVAFQMTYSAEDLFGVGVTNPVENWIVDRFYRSNATTKDFINLIDYVPYDEWILDIHSSPDSHGEPKRFTVFPNEDLFAPVNSTDVLISVDSPDDVYTYTCHYNRKPQSLSVDADIPICPPEHHDAIVFQAITDLAAYTGNLDIYSTASVRANQLYNNLLRSQNPSKTTRQRPIV